MLIMVVLDASVFDLICKYCNTSSIGTLKGSSYK